MTYSVTSNAAAVAADLGKIPGELFDRVADVIDDSAIDVRDQWRENATETAGTHGKHYPKRIEADTDRVFGAISATIEPKPGRQGDMSFEFGSANQPPHLDGQRAIDTHGPLIQRRIRAALSF